jgi:hypothetical protein
MFSFSYPTCGVSANRAWVTKVISNLITTLQRGVQSVRRAPRHRVVYGSTNK